MKRVLFSLLALVCFQVQAASLLDDKGVDMLKADKVYLLSNLHPDEQNSRLYAVNYQLPALLPMCTEVVITKFNRKKMIFSVPSRGNREYTYLYHKAAAEPFEDHLKLFFGSSCDDSKVAKMSKKDQEGIKQGRPIVGMTKAGILLAMGHPPKHVNPTLDSTEWMYWRNKFARTAITFDDKGIVVGIR
ncbi:hypothetical protein [Halioxenophilus sp. WMMB6]|uniref:hypothetical protein n=1 Tax=Halioxenophilus sp. WMMB6 TaxID=3073815 RepID=UPI00295E3F89|nr:hypothetical protein [Halioxenophilus sp. WMMB6]